MGIAASKLKIVISDFHLSRGKWLKDGRRNPLEDFHEDDRFRELLEHYSTGEFADTEVELIINGDFFDPLAIVPNLDGKLTNLEYPLEVQEAPAVEKYHQIVAGHPVSIKALRDFLSRGKRIVFRWGNHDASVLWPKVQAYLTQTLSPPRADLLEFQMRPYIFDRICVVHGHQYETIHQFDEERIFIERETPRGKVTIQNLPFGSFFCLGFLSQLKLQKSYINQVYPFSSYLKVSFFLEPITAITNGAKACWFFIKMRFITHPMRFARFNKTLVILSELFHRPSLEDAAEDILSQPGTEFDTLIMGHNHQAKTRNFPGGKQYINTGTWTPITSLDMGTLGHKILRTYALIEYVDGKPRSSLKIWNGKPKISDDFA